MGDILIDLAPLILSATLVPLYPVGAAYAAEPGWAAQNRCLRLRGRSRAPDSGDYLWAGFPHSYRNLSRVRPALIASTLLLVVGILLLVAAYKKWRNQADPDDPPPQWMQGVGALGVPGSGRRSALGGDLGQAVVSRWLPST